MDTTKYAIFYQFLFQNHGQTTFTGPEYNQTCEQYQMVYKLTKQTTVMPTTGTFVILSKDIFLFTVEPVTEIEISQ